MSTKRIRELEEKIRRLDARVTEIEQAEAAQIKHHMLDSHGIKRLTKRYSKAANLMTGRTVEVRLREPSSLGSAGVFCRTENKGYIDITPELDAWQSIYVFLHEIGHVRFHWDDIAASESYLELPRSKSSPGLSQAHEDQVDEFAHKWEDKLKTEVDELSPNYEDLALDWLIERL